MSAYCLVTFEFNNNDLYCTFRMSLWYGSDNIKTALSFSSLRPCSKEMCRIRGLDILVTQVKLTYHLK